ncbi:uncharacterized protein LOC126378027 isoform X2 [Pectinophora gossypiella]|uniref:uncharacterized protein LOC126378027 isoform X2 n=1 Tax=Pectinophora gossypiella TaxID=13191 RepID=UPI00214E029F|nr:uncharacterized protein LOC126378027 isoform X2 [Pectinophora gossypiella]
MSVSVEESSPLSEGQSTTQDQTISKSSSESVSLNKNGDEAGESNQKGEKSGPSTPKCHPMAFTIDFGDTKQVDNRRLEELAKKSQARHQRVQSMSASLTRPSPAPLKPPMSAKLPRKAQGYNSEGYFSSDQEDSGLSGSVKLRSSPLAQSVTSPISTRHIKSPDALQPKRTSKSPIVDSIMSRSDNFSNRQGLNLPLKNSANSSYVMRDVHRTPSYGSLAYQPRPMEHIIDQSPEGVMLTDISSPELDILTPDNGLSTPEHSKSPFRKGRASSETPDLLFQKCPPKVEPLYVDDDVDRQSNNSSTGTYTIEGDNYTEEQKARMSIDRTFGTDLLDGAIQESLKKHAGSNERDPELIFDYPNRVITKEPRRDLGLRSPISTNAPFDIPTKISKDKNVLEISCCYESPTEHDLAAQTSKQIKSTRSYLEKIKNRVRTITEKTFAKSPPKPDLDFGNFTSVTTSGVLSSKKPCLKIDVLPRRRCSLTKSEIDQTDYIHRLSRESSVPVNLPSNAIMPFDDSKFESTALKNAQKALRDDSGVSSDITPEQVVGKLSYLSLNRCKGDKTWIQDWAESVKKYNNNGLSTSDLNATFTLEDRPPLSPRHTPGKPRSPHGGTPTKIPSPVGTLLSRRTPDLIPTQDTESYLLKTQNAITNLQAKLQSSRTSNFTTIPSQLTSSLISEKTAASRLPVSQLSRSNSLNYRLRRKDANDSSPLRSPGHYVITGSTKVPEGTKILLNSASRSLDTERRRDSRDSNMNSPSSDKGLLSNSSDDKTLSNRPQYDVNAILSSHRKTHARHKSFEGRNANDVFNFDCSNANETVCLKTVLKHNALESKYPRIDQMRCQDTKTHQRVFSDGNKMLKHTPPFGCSIKRSSSFNTVNKNNNYLEPTKLISRRSSGHSEYKEYLSDESETDYDKDPRYKRPLHRGRIDSPDLKSIAPANSPRCPNTPELQRKFGPGLVRNSVRVTNKERAVNTRMSEPPVGRDERKPVNHQSRKISEPTRQAVLNRLTKSRSSTRELQPKNQEKGQKRPSQHRSSSALASKEAEYTNWKKRSSYDPMKAAQEGKRRQMAKRQECNKDDLSSPSHSSPVHRSQSFHTTNIADLTLDYSSEETEDDHTLPIDPMVTSTHSDILDLRPKEYEALRPKENLRRQPLTNDVVLARDYVTNFQVNQPDKQKRQTDKRKTFIIDDTTPTKENIDFLTKREETIDKRKTFILDSDTNSTTNGSSPRNSSIFSHEKTSLTTGTSDTEGESGPESAPVVLRHPAGKRAPNSAKQRYSGDYSMSSSTTSISQKKPKEIQPRYLDISKYKNEVSPRAFLRKDPSKTYISALGDAKPSRPSAQRLEMEQKKQELEKWKRRASYDPRKAAALGKTGKLPAKTASVLRSQSFHGPMLVSTTLRYQPPPQQIVESCDASSDNDF